MSFDWNPNDNIIPIQIQAGAGGGVRRSGLSSTHSFESRRDHELVRIALLAQDALRQLHVPANGRHCVAGLDGPASIRVHFLTYVPPGILEAVEREVSQHLSSIVMLKVTSPFFNVSLAPLPPGTWSNLLPETGEACGGCGTRAVRNRRCGFCGARA